MGYSEGTVGYNGGTVRVQWGYSGGYSGGTVRVQWGYSGGTFRDNVTSLSPKHPLYY